MSESTTETQPESTEEPKGFEVPQEYIEDGKILGRYENTQQMLDALAGMGAPTQEAAEAPEAPAPEAPESTGSLDNIQIEEAPEAPTGLSPESLNKYAEEAIRDGRLGEESLKALEAAGIDRTLADQHVQGLLAQRREAAREVSNLVGGEDAVKGALDWAARNLDAAERNEINAALNNASSPRIQAAIIESLVKRSGVIPKSVGGKSAAPITGQPYGSEAQWMKDIQSQEYKTDPAFRAKVSERLKSTQASGGFKHV